MPSVPMTLAISCGSVMTVVVPCGMTALANSLGETSALAQKYIRLKRIKVNGARAQRDQKLVAGDILQCYINDEFFESPSEENIYPHDDAAAQDRLRGREHPALGQAPGNARPRGRTGESRYARHPHLAYLYQKSRMAATRARRSPPLSATASTATPVASSSRQKTPKRCAS